MKEITCPSCNQSNTTAGACGSCGTFVHTDSINEPTA